MRSLIILLLFSASVTISAQHAATQTEVTDSTNFRNIYPFALRGDMASVFEILDRAADSRLTEHQVKEKQQLYQRFRYRNEAFAYHTTDQQIKDLYDRFRNYWTAATMNEVDREHADSLFRKEMAMYLKKHLRPELTTDSIVKNAHSFFNEFFSSKNLYGNAMGKTGHLYDLYLWKEQEEVVYPIDLPEGKTLKVPVVFMRDFISNGWSHYTTLGHSFTGGWATKEKLFCVSEAYGDKNEEEFLISYVSHEGQHFSDYQDYPNLKQTDLEYRAKLTELALAKKSVNNLLQKFIFHSRDDASNAHAFANFTVISALSQRLLGSAFERDLKKWEQLPADQINREAILLLKEHSAQLKALGADTVEACISRK